MAKNKIIEIELYLEIEKFMYQNIEVTVNYSTSDKSFHTCSKIGNAFDCFDSSRGNFTMGFETPAKAIEAIKRLIDDTIDNIATTTYEELAAKISSFVFDIDEGIEADTLKLILDNFKLQDNGDNN